jgi:hypothetical protein
MSMTDPSRAGARRPTWRTRLPGSGAAVARVRPCGRRRHR